MKYNDDGTVSIDCSLYDKESGKCGFASCPLKSYWIDEPNKWSNCHYGVLKVSWTNYIKNKNKF
jgi:hypothetical protein